MQNGGDRDKAACLLRMALLGIAVLMTVCHGAGFAHAQGRQELIVGVANRAPWSYVSGDGRIIGADVAILKAMEDRLGVTFIIEMYPWRRCIQRLEHGFIDLIARFSHTPEREQFAHYIQPAYSKEAIVLYVKKERGPGIRRYEDLYGKRVGVIRGNSHTPRFDADANIKRTLLNHKSQLFSMLVTERIDVAITFEWVARHQLNIQALTSAVTECPLRFPRDDADHFAFSKKSANLDIAPRFGRLVAQMVASGEMEQLLAASVYGGQR